MVVEEPMKGEDGASDNSAISFDATGLRKGGPPRIE